MATSKAQMPEVAFESVEEIDEVGSVAISHSLHFQQHLHLEVVVFLMHPLKVLPETMGSVREADVVDLFLRHFLHLVMHEFCF